MLFSNLPETHDAEQVREMASRMKAAILPLVRDSGGAVSLAELSPTGADYDLLLRWAAGLPCAVADDFLTGKKTHRRTDFGLVFLLFAAETARRNAKETELWRTIRPHFCQKDTYKRLFPGDYIHYQIKEVIEEAARVHHLRHVFDVEGEKLWMNTVYLQFGMTRRGLAARLPVWLSWNGGTQSLNRLLRGGQKSSSFNALWKVLNSVRHSVRHRTLPPTLAKEHLAQSCWLLPEWADEVLKSAQADLPRGFQAEGAYDAGEIALPPLWGPPQLIWNPPHPPAFTVRFQNGDLYPWEIDYYPVFAGAVRAAEIFPDLDKQCVEIHPHAAVRLEAPDAPTVLLEIQNGDTGECAHAHALSLWDANAPFTLFDGNGHRVEHGKLLDTNRRYILLVPNAPDTSITPTPEVWSRHMNGCVLYELTPPWDIATQVLCGEAVFPVNSLASAAGTPTSEPPDRDPLLRHPREKTTQAAPGVYEVGGERGWMPVSPDAVWTSDRAATLPLRIVPPPDWNIPAQEVHRLPLFEGRVRIGYAGERSRARPSGYGAPLRVHIRLYNDEEKPLSLCGGVVDTGIVRQGDWAADTHCLTLKIARLTPDDVRGGEHSLLLYFGSEYQIVPLSDLPITLESVAETPLNSDGTLPPHLRDKRRVPAHTWQVDLRGLVPCSKPLLAASVAYKGHWQGTWCAETWHDGLCRMCDDYHAGTNHPADAEKSAARLYALQNAGTVAALMRWMHLPLLLRGAKTHVRRYAHTFGVRCLAAWGDDFSLPNELRYGRDADTRSGWRGIVSELLGEWEPDSKALRGLLRLYHDAPNPVLLLCEAAYAVSPLLFGRILLGMVREGHITGVPTIRELTCDLLRCDNLNHADFTKTQATYRENLFTLIAKEEELGVDEGFLTHKTKGLLPLVRGVLSNSTATSLSALQTRNIQVAAGTLHDFRVLVALEAVAFAESTMHALPRLPR